VRLSHSRSRISHRPPSLPVRVLRVKAGDREPPLLRTSTAVTETVYRQQIRPVIVGGAEAMDRIFRESATASEPIVTHLVTQRPNS
jgi:hypothetical protein